MKTFRTFLVVLLLAVFLSGCGKGQRKPGAASFEATRSGARPTAVQPAAVEKEAPTATFTAPVSPVPDATATLAPSPESTQDPNMPRAVVNDFYNWFLAQPRGEVINDRTFRAHPLVSGTFIADTDYLLDEMIKEGPGYDPFTCAQNDLPGLTVGEIVMSGGQAYALTKVIIDGQVRHYMVVALSTGEGPWKIDTIFCPTQPVTPVIAFYTWYLGYTFGDVDLSQTPEPLHDPLAERIYRHSFLLTGQLIEEIDALVEAAQAAGTDPILNSQVYPLDFFVEPWQEGAAVTARLHYDARTNRYHTFTLVEEQGNWKIDEIEHVQPPVFDPQRDADVDTSGWQVFSDPEYDFSFRYPTGWYPQILPLDGGYTDDPFRLRVLFKAQGLPIDRYMLSCDVLEGNEAQMLAFYATDTHQVLEVNGLEMWVDSDPYTTRYIFPHPNQENVYIILQEGRLEEGKSDEFIQALQHQITPLLRSVVIE